MESQSSESRRNSCFSSFSDLLSLSSEETEMPAPPTPLEKLVAIQSEAEFLLQRAIMSERARKWEKVVEMYSSMLKLIAKTNMPLGFTLNDSYVMLLYESYYHLGMALQNLDRHAEAIIAYSKSMKAVNIHKNGCLAGCSSNSCFQTPVLAKRAFAHAKVGNMKKAMIDIEKAVVLDTRNSDLYCIRALLWNTNKDTEKAVDDLNRALRYNPCHVCALVLRGTIDQPFRITLNFLEGLVQNKKEMKKDHVKATQINPKAAKYTDISDIHSSKVIDFWNRFLWSLNVPRNIMHVDLLEGFNSNAVAQAPATMRRCSSTPLIQINGTPAESISPDFDTSEGRKSQSPSPPFKCGTPNVIRDVGSAKRRHSYGQAVRTYSAALKATANSLRSRPSSAYTPDSRPPTSNSIALPRCISASETASMPRPPSGKSKQRPSVSFSQPLLLSPSGRRKGALSAPPNMNRAPSRSSLAPSSGNVRRASLAVLPTTSFSVNVDITALSTKAKINSDLARRRIASDHVHRVHGMRIFEPPDVDNAPRMYYKPWTGDKLPVADMKHRPAQVAFRV